MRVVQLKPRKVLTLCGLSGLCLIVLYLISNPGNSSLHPKEKHLIRNEPQALKRHQSHPGDVPKFLGMMMKIRKKN